MKKQPLIGILLGNSAGVGPELIAKMAAERYFDEHCDVVIIGDARMFAHGLSVIGAEVPYYTVKSIDEIAAEENDTKGKSGESCNCDEEGKNCCAYPVLDLGDQDPDCVEYGVASAYCGAGDLNQLETAILLCREGKLDGFVYAPFHKGAMKLAGMHDESEQSYMARRFELTTPSCEINMMDDLMTVRTTSHIPISEVSRHLTEETIREAIELGEIAGERLGRKPRIAVAALNPHCGEFGLCGREEIDVIAPTIEKVVKETGWNVTGPYSADTLFIRALEGDFDVVVTMYHDQGQIALKLVGFQRCITFAGGQPYPIATCGHGTAFDKVGTGTAGTDSLKRAVAVVAGMARRI